MNATGNDIDHDPWANIPEFRIVGTSKVYFVEFPSRRVRDFLDFKRNHKILSWGHSFVMDIYFCEVEV